MHTFFHALYNKNIPKNKVQNAPTVTWPAEDGALYTLIMTGQFKPMLLFNHSLLLHYQTQMLQVEVTQNGENGDIG